MVGKSWYVSRNGKRRGPLSDDQLKQAVANGKVTHRDFVWYDGLQDWVEAGKVKGLFASPPPPPEPPEILEAPLEPPGFLEAPGASGYDSAAGVCLEAPGASGV